MSNNFNKFIIVTCQFITVVQKSKLEFKDSIKLINLKFNEIQLDARGKGGQTALAIADVHEDIEIVEELLEAGASHEPLGDLAHFRGNRRHI